jgi:hypothetical protein
MSRLQGEATRVVFKSVGKAALTNVFFKGLMISGPPWGILLELGVQSEV